MSLDIKLNKKVNTPSKRPFQITTPHDKRYGFWATVTEIHPEDNTVHVRMDNGMYITGLRVASTEWVTVDNSKNYLSGERHLPPIDTYVFCLMPTGEIASAFVLCSGFARQAAIHADFKAQDVNDSNAANTWERVENSGWKRTVDYRNGSKKIMNTPTEDDATIKLDINQGENGEETDGVVTLKVYDTTITLSEADKNIKVETVANTELSIKEGKLLLSTDADIEMKTSMGITEIGNSINTLGAMVSSLLGYLAALKTVGSPATQTASPDFIAQVQALKTQWEAVFK